MNKQADPAWVRGLMMDFPDLEPLYEAHVKEFGKLLPHLLFGDVVRWAVAASEAGNIETVRSFANRLEHDYPDLDSGSRNLIEVSFVEDLPSLGQVGAEIGQLLGPALRDEYVRTHHRAGMGG